MSVVVRVEGPDAQNTVLHSCSSLTRCPSLFRQSRKCLEEPPLQIGLLSVVPPGPFVGAPVSDRGGGADAGSFSQVSGLRWLHQLVAGLVHAFWFLRVWTNTCVNASPKQRQQQYNLERLRFNRRGASTPLWGVEACSPPSRRPNPIPAIPPYVVRTPRLHGAPSTEGTVKL